MKRGRRGAGGGGEDLLNLADTESNNILFLKQFGIEYGYIFIYMYIIAKIAINNK